VYRFDSAVHSFLFCDDITDSDIFGIENISHIQPGYYFHFQVLTAGEK